MSVCEDQLEQIQYDLANETKSSAGDKYETGRAMLQIEREKIVRQLAELEQLEQVMKSVDPMTKHLKVQLGSLVQTNDNHFFIAVSLGEITIDGLRFYAISKQTPMAQVLLGKSKGDKVSFRESSFKIEAVL
jgi:transcription elongation GreA/GreB family factor